MSATLDVRGWLDRLKLTDAEAADALNLSNRNVIIREYKRGAANGGKDPAPPTMALMDMTEIVVEALVLLRTGRSHDAERKLRQALTGPLMRHVIERAPGR